MPDVANARDGHLLTYLEPRLTAETARWRGCPVVCPFVNDDQVDRSVVPRRVRPQPRVTGRGYARGFDDTRRSEPMRWDEFERECPQIARTARERFARDEVVMVGTIRPDGSPRMSPNEVDFAQGRLFLGMMWRSQKALDLLRDPRVAVHSVPSDRFNPGGDVKLYGRVVDEGDPDVRAAFREEIRRRIDWAPDEPNYHLFSLDVRQAGFISFGDDNRRAMAWDVQRGFREPKHPDAS